MKRLLKFSVFIVALVLISCNKEDFPEMGTNCIIIVNTLAETISFYDLDSDTLFEDVIETGRTPNDLLIRGDLGIVVNSGFQGIPALDVVDLATKTRISRKLLPPGSNPYSICHSNDRYYVTLAATNKIYVLSDNLIPVDSFITGNWPEGICEYNGKLFVAVSGFDYQSYTYGDGYVYIIDTNQRPYTFDSVRVSTNPQAIKVFENRIWIMCTGDYWNTAGRFYRINPYTNTIEDSISTSCFPGDFIYTKEDILFTDFMNGVFSLMKEGELDTLLAVSGASKIILDNNRAVASIFSASGLNYLVIIDLDSFQILKIIAAGQAKGVGPIGIYRR